MLSGVLVHTVLTPSPPTILCVSLSELLKRKFPTALCANFSLTCFHILTILECNYVLSNSDSVGTRTQDPQLRRLLLYPTELRNPRGRKRNRTAVNGFADRCLIHSAIRPKNRGGKSHLNPPRTAVGELVTNSSNIGECF